MKKVIASLLMAAMLICLCSCGVSTEDKYNNAAADVKAGNYDKAIETFEALNGYQDSDEYIMYAKCLKAGDSDEYDAAIKSLQTLGDFKEASMYIKYYTALSYEAEQEYEAAQKVYDEILLFKDVQERSKQIPDKIIDRDLAEATYYIDNGISRGLDILSDVLNKRYSASDSLLFETVMDYAKKKYDAKDYETAAEVYECVADKGYTKAKEPFKASVYAVVEQHVNESDYRYAKSLIVSYLTGYKGADVLLNECDYQLTLQKAEYQGSDAAQEVYDTFKALGTYKDSAERAKAYEDQYAAAVEKRSRGEYDAAAELFTWLGTYSDAVTQILETKYQAAVALMNEGRYKNAIDTFSTLEGYRDCKSMITECETAIQENRYQTAVKLMNEGKYKNAIDAFNALDGYRDSNEQILECQYCRASALLENGKYAEAADIYVNLKGYKDVDSLVEKDENLLAAVVVATARETKWQLGNYVTFGIYPQTETGTDSTPIEWIVLARDGDKALVTSRYALDCAQYNTQYDDVTWETCTLRQWLNNDFYNKAFNVDEKQNIILSTVTADKNPNYDTNPGNDTTDRVFLLSVIEADKYFKDNDSRKCAPTDYAAQKGRWNGTNPGRCWWWLRSPSDNGYYATGIDTDGFIHNGTHVYYNYRSVRPCVWVRLF